MSSLKTNILCRMRRSDLVLIWSLRSCAITSASIIVLMCLYLFFESGPALEKISLLQFLTDTSWHPTEGTYNMTPMIVGTLLSTLGAVLLAAPLGIGSALFCRYIAPQRIAKVYRRIIELMAGIPSVVYGFWGLVMLVPIVMKISPPGPSLFSGIIVLTLMILPTVTLITDASLANVPAEMLRGAEALGLSRWSTIRNIVFPVARSGMITGIILGTGRAIGETMAILMVCGNVVQLPDSLFAPVRTLTANIALEMAYAMDFHRSILFVSGLVLAIMVMALIFLAELASKRRQQYG